MEENIKGLIKESIEVKKGLLCGDIGCIERAIEILVDTLRGGKKVLIFGNGGSAADAQHLAAEFVNRFLYDRPPLACIALTTDTSVLTSISNDSDYKYIFRRQIEALGASGDAAIGISTSGSSPNVLEGLKMARQIKMSTIAFVGESRGAIERYSDIVISVPSASTPRIQEAHIMIGHIICQLIEEKIFPKQDKGKDQR